MSPARESRPLCSPRATRAHLLIPSLDAADGDRERLACLGATPHLGDVVAQFLMRVDRRDHGGSRAPRRSSRSWARALDDLLGRVFGLTNEFVLRDELGLVFACLRGDPFGLTLGFAEQLLALLNDPARASLISSGSAARISSSMARISYWLTRTSALNGTCLAP
jgi:hypothetical protein